MPEPTKASRPLSIGDRVRLKVVTDFAQTLPLVEPDHNVTWLVNVIETEMGMPTSIQVYKQLLDGELQLRYEPAWMRHPAYEDLTTLLQGQSILEELNTFVADVARCASEAVSLIQQVYRDAAAELLPDFLERGGWRFISTVYADEVSWYGGKSLRDPSERDYTIRPREASGGSEERWLYGEEATSFAGELILAQDDEAALQLRALHLRLRRAWRSNELTKQAAAMITQLQLQRAWLLSVFSQFGQLKQ